MPLTVPAPPGSAGAEPGQCTLQTFNEITGGIDFWFILFQKLEIVPLRDGEGGQKGAVQCELCWTWSHFTF